MYCNIPCIDGMNRNNNIGMTNDANTFYGMNVGNDISGMQTFSKNAVGVNDNRPYGLRDMNDHQSLNNRMYHGAIMNPLGGAIYGSPVNNMNESYRNNEQQTDCPGLFSEVKKNVSIFGNRVASGPLFAKVDSAIKKNREELFFFTELYQCR